MNTVVCAEMTVINDVFPSEELTKKTRGESFDIITSIAMFYDLENPLDFVIHVKRIFPTKDFGFLKCPMCLRC